MTGWRLQQELSGIIDKLIDRHPQGLRILVGEAPPPVSKEIYAMYSMYSPDDPGIRIQGGDMKPQAEAYTQCVLHFEKVIEESGGWDHITATAREWRTCFRSTWDIVQDHIRFVSLDFSKIDQSQLEHIANKYHVSKDTVWRRRRDFPILLAECILKAPSPEYFELRTQESCER